MTPRTLHLPRRAALAVMGADARPFLHRLLTQDVDTLGVGDLRYAALLTPQGRVLYDLFLYGEADGVVVDVAADAREALIARLDAFKLRAAVRIEPLDHGVHVLWGVEAAPPGWRPDPRTPQAGFRTVGDASPPVEALVAEPLEHFRHRLSLGLPDAVRDGLSDKAYATELDLDLLNGVDFRKGCFVGQETTSRMKRRGGVRSRVLPLDFEGEAPPRGTEVMADRLRAGEIVASHGSRALALVRLDRLSGDLQAAEIAARVDRPIWAPSDEATPPSPQPDPQPLSEALS